jgi:hypothetical protein
MIKDPFEPLVIKPLKKVYVCIDKRGYPQAETIKPFKAWSIQALIGDNTTWKAAVKHGWRCIKVNIEFDPV